MNRPLLLALGIPIVILVLLALFTVGGDPDDGEFSEQTRAELRRLATSLEQTEQAIVGRLDGLAERLALLEEKGLALSEAVGTAKVTAPTGTERLVVGTEDGLEEAAAESDADTEGKLQEALEAFFDPDIPPNEKQAKWSELAEAGLLDDVVALLEQNVEENPEDPEAHAQLGHAYIQKIFTVSEVEKMRWAMQAHGAYDEALQLDDHHWEARFSKAVSYSFAPPVFGLQPKAIEHFEVLRAQQAEQAPQERFADTYELLGNMYQNSGNQAKAVEVWRQGANLYPDDHSLQDKVRSLPGESAGAADE